MSYQAMLRKHRRLSILRHLAESSDYTSNASILTDVLNGVGVTSTRDQVVTELHWLRDNGHAELTESGDFIVVKATRAGVEVAQGRTTHPEIQRPSPKG